MRGFQVAFGGKNGEFICKILIINILLECSKHSKKSVRRTFLSIWMNFCIWLIINDLSLTKNFYLFVLGKKMASSVKSSFWAKISFCQIGKWWFSMFLAFHEYTKILYTKQVFPICVFSERMCHEINFLFTFALANQKNN